MTQTLIEFSKNYNHIKTQKSSDKNILIYIYKCIYIYKYAHKMNNKEGNSFYQKK